MAVDAHCHLFTPRMLKGMARMPGMLRELHLDVEGALGRLGPEALQRSAEAHDLAWCMLLPSAGQEQVRWINDRYLEVADSFPRLRTLGTLHPEMDGLDAELDRLIDRGCPGIKLSTFSQRFDLDSPAALAMLHQVEQRGVPRGSPLVLVLDTFVRADVYFGADPRHLTTPARVHRVAERFGGISVVGAHLGGLAAPFDTIQRDLRPLENLYLDTSNATHLLAEHEVLRILRDHGPSHVMFGTDWPWFPHDTEMPRIEALLVQAGLGEEERAAVMAGNAVRLFGG